MRNAQAFEIKLRIEHKAFSKIGLKELMILRFKNIER